jgi:ATP-binding cassette, subfamily B (MDR/TAP), member 1
MGDEKTTAKRDAPAPQGWRSVFSHADAVDVALMVLGLLGAVGNGMSSPLRLFVSSRIVNDVGRGPTQHPQFGSKINEV